MHPEMNHSLSLVPSSLNLLADLDILAKSVDPDFVPVSDVVLFSSFDLPANTSINDLSKGTLVHRLISDASVRPSSEWWLDALDTVFKYCPTEIDVAPCAAEIYLARVAQSHIEAGHAQLDNLEGKASGMQFIDSNEESVSIVFKQEGGNPWSSGEYVAPTGQDSGEAPSLPVPASGTQAELDLLDAQPDISTPAPEDAERTFAIGGPIVGADNTPLTAATFDPGIIAVEKDLDGALVREGRRGEEIHHDNVDAAAMGGSWSFWG